MAAALGRGEGTGREARGLERRAGWAVAAGVTAVSFAALLVRLSSAPAEALAFYRLGMALGVLLPWSLLFRREAYRRLTRAEWGLGLMAGLFLGLHYVTWFYSLQHTSVLSSTVLVTLQPFFVLAIGYGLWRRRVTARAAVGLALAIAGGLLIGGGDLQVATSSLRGDLLALGAAALVSVYLVVGEVQRRRQELLSYVCVVYGTAVGVIGLMALARGVPLAGFAARDWWLFAGLAVGPTLLGHTVFNWALAYVPASRVAVAILGEPVGATLWAWLFLAEVPTGVQLAGAALILAGVGWYQAAAAPSLSVHGLSIPEDPEGGSGVPPGRR
ncbi:membrane protein [Limnochorda pilosa]|uniref:Membrane protein n=2 Tax=Limnochorda pilosa TaxID=1555112 RepID=A0A0K2SIX4_LIMPI|nr:membrane protein [Limnochorda pilosa]